MLSLSGIGAYGWAKPVPVATNRLRSPRNHTVLVSLVGPLTNFILAALMGARLRPGHPAGHPPDRFDSSAASTRRLCSSQILFIGRHRQHRARRVQPHPVPAADGAAVLERFLPARLLPEYYRLQPLLMFLPFVLILLFRNQWSELIGHVVNWWSGLLV